MADIKSVTVLTELQDFLDKLPAKPCPENPGNADFCTICKRLNRQVATGCKYSGLEVDAEKPEDTTPETGPETVEFKPVSDDVETKQVVPPESDEDFPMIEIVKPTTTPKKPVEMELLDDVAIEFEVMDEDSEPVEVEALEVEPLEDDEFEEEGEVIQFEAADDVELGEDDEIADSVVFEPEPEPSQGPPGTMPTIVPPPPVAQAPPQAVGGQKVVPRKRVKLKRKPPAVRKPVKAPKVARKPVRKAKVKLKPKRKKK